MFTIRSYSFLGIALLCLCADQAMAQQDGLPFADEDLAWLGDTLTGPDEAPDPYERLNAALGADSVRLCQGVPCSGWLEDHSADGTLVHKGYYGDGRLITYRNFHPNGQVAREFKVKDNTRCAMRTWYDSGALRSETDYVEGMARSFTEYYLNGQIRYAEEKHASLPCYTIMDLFAPDGKPVSTLRLVDKKHLVFEQREHWPNGNVRASGRSQFNQTRYDQQRIGAWTYHDTNGRPVKEERYIEGKVHETADLR